MKLKKNEFYKLTMDDVVNKLHMARDSKTDFHLGDMLLDLCEAIQNEFNMRDKNGSKSRIKKTVRS